MTTCVYVFHLFTSNSFFTKHWWRVPIPSLSSSVCQRGISAKVKALRASDLSRSNYAPKTTMMCSSSELWNDPFKSQILGGGAAGEVNELGSLYISILLHSCSWTWLWCNLVHVFFLSALQDNVYCTNKTLYFFFYPWDRHRKGCSHLFREPDQPQFRRYASTWWMVYGLDNKRAEVLHRSQHKHYALEPPVGEGRAAPWLGTCGVGRVWCLLCWSY